MPDLIVHIGLPKTGTTTIHKNLLRSTPGFLGRTAGAKKDLGHQFSNIFRRTHSPRWLSQANSWNALALALMQENWPGIRRLIVSDEGLSQRKTSHLLKWPIGSNEDIPGKKGELRSRPIISYLKQFNDYVWFGGDVKALIILRNQADWLASLYTQRSDRIAVASQEDFETQVEKLIERDDIFIDWSSWVDELQCALGHDNVCALLMEDMRRELFWDQIAEFLEINQVSSYQLSKPDAPKSNVRRTTPNAWAIRPLGDNAYPTVNLIRKYWGTNRLPYARRMVCGLTKRLSHYAPLDALTKFILNSAVRGATIEMTPALRERILTYCRPFNERLAQQLNRNKKELGDMGYLL